MQQYETVKRVPIGFNWPLGKVWRGYENPVPGPQTCEHCHGTGWNEATYRIYHGFNRGNSHDEIMQDEVEALVKAGFLIELTHDFNNRTGEWKQKTWETKGYWCLKCHEAVPQLSPDHYSAHCTACDRDMVLLSGNDIRLQIPTVEAVMNRSRFDPMLLVDCRIPGILTRARAKRLGVYGWCESCGGRGETRMPRKRKKAYRRWRECEPPVGSGWQLWQEGNVAGPQSPVFASAEILAQWCVGNARMNDTILTRDRWRAILLADAGELVC